MAQDASSSDTALCSVRLRHGTTESQLPPRAMCKQCAGRWAPAAGEGVDRTPGSKGLANTSCFKDRALAGHSHWDPGRWAVGWVFLALGVGMGTTPCQAYLVFLVTRLGWQPYLKVQNNTVIRWI